MSCTCNSTVKIKPFEVCVHCAHKHLSTALAISSFNSNPKDPLVVRVASQIQLGAWHLQHVYENEYNNCLSIIKNIFNLKDYKNDLRNLVELSWELLEKNRMVGNDSDEAIMNQTENNFYSACLHVANAIELLKYETKYKEINYSYAIGQLVLANWILQNYDLTLVNECRSLYHNIEMNEINLSKIENFRNHLWDSHLYLMQIK